MTQNTTTTTTNPTTWNVDYRWNDKNRKEYFIQVFTSTPHSVEGKTFTGRVAAREAAIQAGLRQENEI